MPTFAGFAALCSLAFAAAGVVVLLIVTLRYGAKRPTDAARDEPGEIPEAYRVRIFRRAAGIALGCFAAAAALGVLGVMQRSPGSADRLVERIRALEHRLDAAEVELETRAITTAALAAIDRHSVTTKDGGAKGERLVREVADADAHTPSVVKPPHRNSGSMTVQKSAVSQAANNARRPARSEPIESHSPIPQPLPQPPPEAVPPALVDTSPTSDASSPTAPPSAPVSPAPPSPVVSAPMPSVAAALPERDAPRPGTPPDSSQPTLAAKIRSDWETIKRAAREGGDDWAEGWRRLRRLFSD